MIKPSEDFPTSAPVEPENVPAARTIVNPRLEGANIDLGYFLENIDQLTEADWDTLLGTRGVMSGEALIGQRFLDKLKKKLLSQATPQQRVQVDRLIAELQENLPYIQERFIEIVDNRFQRLQAITAVHTDISKLGTWHEISRQVLKQVLARIVREYLQPISASEATPNFWRRRAEQPDLLTGEETNEGDPGMRTERTSHYSMGNLETAIVERWQGRTKVEQIADFIQAQLMATVTFQYESNQAGIKAAKKKKKRRANFHIPKNGPVRYLLCIDGKPYHLELPVSVATRSVPSRQDIFLLIQQALQSDPPAISADEWQRLYDVSSIPDSKKQRKDQNVKALIGEGKKKVHFIISTGSQADENGQENDPYDPASGVITFGKNTIAHFRLNTATPDESVFSHLVGKAAHAWFNGMPFRDYIDIIRAELMMKGQETDEQTTRAQQELAFRGDFRGEGIRLQPSEKSRQSNLHFRREFFHRQTLSDLESQQLMIAWKEINKRFKAIGISITPQDLISFSIAMNLHRNIHVVRALPDDGTLLDVPMLAASSNWIQQFYESRYGKPLAAISDEERATLIKDFIYMMRLFNQEKEDAEFSKSITAVFAELSGETFEKTTDTVSGMLAPELRDMVTNRVGGMLSAFVDGKVPAVEARKKVMVQYALEKIVGNTNEIDFHRLTDTLLIVVEELLNHIQKKINYNTRREVLNYLHDPPKNLRAAISWLIPQIQARLKVLSPPYSQLDAEIFRPIIENIILQPLEDIEVTTANPFVYGYKARARLLNNKPDPIDNTHQFGSPKGLNFEQGGVFSLSKKQGESVDELFDLCVRMSPEQFNPDRLTEHIATMLVNKGVDQGRVVNNEQYTFFRDQLVSQFKKNPGFRNGLVEYLLALSDYSNPDSYRQEASKAIFKIGESCFSKDAENTIAYILKANLGLMIGRQSLNEYIQEAMNLYAQEEVQLVFDGMRFVSDILLTGVDLQKMNSSLESTRRTRREGKLPRLVRRWRELF